MRYLDQGFVNDSEWDTWKITKCRRLEESEIQDIFESIQNTETDKHKGLAPRLLDLHEYGDSSREQKDIIALQFLEFMGLQENIIQQLKNGVSSVV